MRLARQVVPGVHIEKVKYFTARVRDFDASGAPRRQDIYLLALQTLGLVEIHFGTFRINAKKRKLVTPLPDGTQFVEVLMPEEKGLGRKPRMSSRSRWRAGSLRHRVGPH